MNGASSDGPLLQQSNESSCRDVFAYEEFRHVRDAERSERVFAMLVVEAGRRGQVRLVTESGVWKLYQKISD
jgi:hypothetical protein